MGLIKNKALLHQHWDIHLVIPIRNSGYHPDIAVQYCI